MNKKTLIFGLLMFGIFGLISTASAYLTVTAVSPAANSWNNYTNTTCPFTFNATSNETITCELFINGTAYLINNSVTSTNNSVMYANATLDEGLHSWNVTCNNSVDSNSTTPRNINLDRSAPSSVTIAYPGNWDWVGDTNVTITATAIDLYNASMHCNITIDGLLKNESFLVTNNTAFTHTELDVTEGTHEVEITCVDGLGFGTTSSMITYKVKEDTETGHPVGVCTGGREWNWATQKCCGVGEFYDPSNYKCRVRATWEVVETPAVTTPSVEMPDIQMDQKTLLVMGAIMLVLVVGYFQIKD